MGAHGGTLSAEAALRSSAEAARSAFTAAGRVRLRPGRMLLYGDPGRFGSAYRFLVGGVRIDRLAIEDGTVVTVVGLPVRLAAFQSRNSASSSRRSPARSLSPVPPAGQFNQEVPPLADVARCLRRAVYLQVGMQTRQPSAKKADPKTFPSACRLSTRETLNSWPAEKGHLWRRSSPIAAPVLTRIGGSSG